MRLLALRGENLASLAGPFALEFDEVPLRGAGILAIAGPTGAGKSTMLDAICLALYDRIPRLERVESGSGIGADALGANDPRAVLRHGAGGGFAEVDFVGQDGRAYRAHWEVRRARNRGNGRLQRQTISLYDIESGAALGGTRTETLAEIEHRIGLDFDQFCRAVLLAQGEFDNFLRAKATDRAALLERITGTEIYSRISIAAFERARAERAEIVKSQQQAMLLAILDAEDRAALEAERARGEAEREALNARVAHLTALLSWHDRTDQLAASLAAARLAETDAQADHDAAEPDRAALALAREAVGLRAELLAAEAADQALAQAITDRREAELAAIAAHDALRLHGAEQEAASAALANVEAAYAAVGPVLDLAQALDASVVSAAEELARRTAERAQARRAEETALQALRSAEIACQAAAAAVAEDEAWLTQNAAFARLDGVLPGLEDEFGRLARARSLHHDAQTKLRQAGRGAPTAPLEDHPLDRASVERDLAEIQAGQLHLAKAQAAGQIFLSEVARRAGATTLLCQYGSEITQSRLQVERAEAELPAAVARVEEAVRTRDLADAAATRTAAELRLALVPGAPCPVCGGTDHQPGIIERLLLERQESARARVGELQSVVDGLRTALATARALEQAATRAAHEQSRLITLADSVCEQALADWRSVARFIDLPDQPADLSQRQQELDGRIRFLSLTILRFDEAEAAARCSESVARIDVSIGDICPTWQALADPLAMLRAQAALWSARQAAVSRDRATLAEAELALASERARLEAATATSARVDSAAHVAHVAHDDLVTRRNGLLDGQPVVAVRQDFDDRIGQARGAVRLAEVDRVAAALQRAKADSELANAVRNHDLALGARSSATSRLDAALAAAGLDRATAMGLLDRAAGLPAESARLEAVSARLRDAMAVRAERAAQYDAHLLGAPEEGRQAVLEARQEVSLRVQLIEEIMRAADVDLRNDDLQRAARARFEHEIVERRASADVWLRLDDLIGSADGARFRRYAQSLTLAHLVFLANRHLWDLRPRYELECAADGDMKLVVRDRDMAGEIRGLHNLSGGERFLVSLALALALAGMSTGAGRHVESLFIDEGFGALDPQSLGMAIGTLEQLQATGRQVVVISHLPDLTERLPVKVMVTPQGGGRSSVLVVVE